MTLEDQLKKTRKMLGISQEKMCDGVLSEAYYSRIERNIDNIRMNDLLDILKNNEISIYDFFNSVDCIRRKSKITRSTFRQMPLNIDQRLKIVRKTLGVNQRVFAHNVFNNSYYSRIERSQNQISANDLVKILNLNRISVIEFLAGFGKLRSTNKLYEKRATTAFANQDIAKLHKLIADKHCKNRMVKQVAQLMINKLECQKVDVNPIIGYFQKNNWDNDSLWLLLTLSRIEPEYKFDKLVNWATDYYAQRKVEDSRTKSLLKEIKAM